MLKKIMYLIVPSLISAFLGGGLTVWIYSDKNEIPYFDKIVSSELSIMSKKNLFSHDVKILIDDVEVEKISKLYISLLNFSNKSYENVKVSVKLNSDKKVKIISAHAVGENSEEDLVKELRRESNNLFDYNVVVVKRTNSDERFFKMIVYYEGEYKFSSDDVSISIMNAEPKIRNYSVEHEPNYIGTVLKVIVLFIIGLIGTMIILVIIFYFISLMFRNVDIKSNKKYAKRLFLVMEGIPDFKNIDEAKRKQIIIDLLYKNRIEVWKSMNWLTRIMDGNSEPKRSNYEF